MRGTMRVQVSKTLQQQWYDLCNITRLFELDDDNDENDEYGNTNEDEVGGGGDGAAGRPSGWGLGWGGKRVQNSPGIHTIQEQYNILICTYFVRLHYTDYIREVHVFIHYVHYSLRYVRA